ncbi:type IV pilus modification PilV family protein [Neptunicella marina]|uniref:Prepilin-type N-terminal cleavage/methylation domain-containing protein n=1 Tax=Neptunicella marina TaxID=2125989 RepID=A0A8J6IUY4_9ALTE|nr:prepilin-type N-terminal cleavage/methylation domain-containing protein [Neptunicella marina]MBC3766113.1 prepilin-type N-terminal cleavage/methylation domain-containing protein [Neptunicella marina]
MPASHFRSFARGFNLIELIIGMLLFAASMAVIFTLIVPQSKQSIDPIFQVRATELAQSMLNEIMVKSFDQQSDRSEGVFLCGSGAENAPDCTAPDALGPDGTETRINFNDVDDYNGLTVVNTGTGANISDLYTGFSLNVVVFYDANMDGIDDNAVGASKYIGVSVTTPNGEMIEFASYRSNY